MHESSSISAYEVVATLARGPDSFLYLSKSRTSDLQAVIKAWHASHTLSAQERERIQEEFEALARLKHPHILPLLEVHITEHEISTVRAYAPGGSLYTRFVRHPHKPLPIDEAVRIIQQVGQAMYTAHQQHITHGNLTPQNVLFTEDDQAVLSDFHFGSILAAIGAYAGESASLRWYMAPEQFQGTRNAATDQYALGCLAYELLTGNVPFSGSARATLFQKHQNEQPAPPRQVNPAIPPHIEQTILKALAKLPAERHPDIQSFTNALGTPDIQPVEPSPIEAQDTQSIPPTGHTPDQGSAQRVSSQIQGTKTGAMSLRQKRQSLGQQGKGTKRIPLLILSAAVVIMLISTFLIIPHALFRSYEETSVIKSPTAGGVTVFTPTSSALSPTTVPRLSPTPESSRMPGLLPPPRQKPDPTPSPTATVTPQAGSIHPIFECIIKQGGNGFHATFGYVNDNPYAVTIPVGSQNSLSPSWLNGAQPTTFLPGSQTLVVQVSVNRGSIVWSLDGNTATATDQGTVCTT